MLKRLFYRIVFLVFFTFYILPLRAESDAKYIPVLLRDIGHNFLLEIGDSSSRVLEVEQNENSYTLRFENEITFTPDQLYNKVHEKMQKYNAQQNFIVEVSTCDSNQIVHSFKASLNRDEEILPCKGRPLPKDCYKILFITSDPWLPHTETLEGESDNAFFPYIILLMIFIPLSTYLWYRKKRGKTMDLLALGLYKFDLQRMKLFFKEEVIELSSLEADLLHLFVQHKNETLKREFILNEVWEDEGNYVGRTLDVFISKLRKKLEKDESIKIVSVRGVGYKFVN